MCASIHRGWQNTIRTLHWGIREDALGELMKWPEPAHHRFQGIKLTTYSKDLAFSLFSAHHEEALLTPIPMVKVFLSIVLETAELKDHELNPLKLRAKIKNYFLNFLRSSI